MLLLSHKEKARYHRQGEKKRFFPGDLNKKKFGA